MFDLQNLLGWLRPAKSDAIHKAPQAPLAAPKPVAAQWRAVEDVLEGSISSVAAAKRFHQAAARQIDSTNYALSQLLIELSTVMTLPARPSAVIIPVRAAQPSAPIKSAQIRRQRAVA